MHIVLRVALLTLSRASLSPPAPAKIRSMNAADHQSEVDKVTSEAWHGESTPTDLPEFRPIAISNWSCPDFPEDFASSADTHGGLVHVTETPLFTAEECAALIQSTEEHMTASSDGWSHIQAGRHCPLST